MACFSSRVGASAMLRTAVLPLLLVFSVLQLVRATDSVPVFIWSNDRSLDLPDALSGEVIGESAFLTDYLARAVRGTGKQGKGTGVGRNVAVFLQDELSLDSLARSADVFNTSSDGAALKHLKVAMTTHNSVFLPVVTSAAAAVESLISDADSLANQMAGDSLANQKARDSRANQKAGDSRANQKAGDSLSNQMVVSELFEPYVISGASDSDSFSSKLFLVRLPDSSSIKDVDDILGAVTKQLEHSGRPFSAVYTASRSSSEPIDESDESEYYSFDGEDETNKVIGGRRLLQADSDSMYVAPAVPSYFTFVNFSNCVYLYTQNITLSVVGYDPWNLPLTPTIDPSSFCVNYTAELSLVYTDVDEILKEVVLQFVFDVSPGMNSGYWFVSNFTLSYTISNDSSINETTPGNLTVLEMNPAFVSQTPYGFSYSCFEMPPILPVALAGQPQLANITFIGLQLQAFNISDDAFGYYNDCRGFFSIQTWACLITLFILAAILFFAACMFLGLSTPDRFDDPRGKTITVNEI